MRRIVPRALLAVAAAGSGACLEPIRIAEPPVLDDRVIVFAALDPDLTIHPLLVLPAEGRRHLTETVARLYRADEGSQGVAWTLVDTTAQIRNSRDSVGVCGRRYSLDGSPQCLALEAVLEPGSTYRVEVSSEGRATARGEARVVGPFAVESAVLSETGESSMLTASWTPSQLADTYLVSVRRYNVRMIGGEQGWFTNVAATSITTEVPEGAIAKALQPLTLDVVAVDPHLWAYMNTGTGGEGYSIPPVQNVDGGFGVVGSYTFRSRAIATGGGS